MNEGTCSRDQSHTVEPGALYCTVCGAPVANEGPTQLAAPRTAETVIFRFKCGRCSTQVGHNATKCPTCQAYFGRDVDIISWDQLSMQDKGLWPVPAQPAAPVAAFVPGPIPGGAFDPAMQQQPQQQSRPWRLIFLAGALILALIVALVFAAYQAGRANQAEQALAAMPTDAAIIVLPPTASPTNEPSPTAQAQPTQAAAAAPTAVPTVAAPPTAIPDERPQIIADTVLHKGTPSGEKLADMVEGDRYKPFYWMNVGGTSFLYIDAGDKGQGWIDGEASDIDVKSLAELMLVQGVKSENANRGFISEFGGRQIAFIFSDGTYQHRVALPGRDGEWVAITNGDYIRIIKREDTTTFFATVSNIIDGNPAVGVSGALPEWVISGENVPPAPTPEPEATVGAGGGGSSCKGTFEAWRYRYTVKVVQVPNGHSRIQAIVNYPGGYCSYVLKSVGVTVGTSLTWGSHGGQTDVANGHYDVSFVQFKTNENAPISTIGVDVTNGVTSQVIFTATEIKDR